MQQEHRLSPPWPARAAACFNSQVAGAMIPQQFQQRIRVDIEACTGIRGFGQYHGRETLPETGRESESENAEEGNREALDQLEESQEAPGSDFRPHVIMGADHGAQADAGYGPDAKSVDPPIGDIAGGFNGIDTVHHLGDLDQFPDPR